MMCFFIGKQKVILFHKFRKNSWVTAASALKMSHTLTVYVQARMSHAQEHYSITSNYNEKNKYKIF
jgi:hypothetical protein